MWRGGIGEDLGCRTEAGEGLRQADVWRQVHEQFDDLALIQADPSTALDLGRQLRFDAAERSAPRG